MLLVFLLIIPIAGGIIGSRYLGLGLNFLLMMALFNFCLTMFFWMITGHFSPLMLIPGAGIFPHVGYLSGVSPGGLVYPPLFLLVAVLAQRLKK